MDDCCSQHREERVTSLKKVLLPSDDDVTENGRFSASAAEMTKNKNALHTGSAVTSASLTPLQPTNAIEGHASITATTSKRDVTSASLNGVATAKSPSEVSPGSNEGERFSAEQLLSNMRVSLPRTVCLGVGGKRGYWPSYCRLQLKGRIDRLLHEVQRGVFESLFGS